MRMPADSRGIESRMVGEAWRQKQMEQKGEHHIFEQAQEAESDCKPVKA